MPVRDPFEQVKSALQRQASGSSDFDLNPDIVLPEGRKLRSAGVLVPVIEREAGLQVILTMRSSALKHHPGQIAFPGGKQDEGDADVTAAALREADEEIGLHHSNIQVLGHLASHETVTGFTVTPVVGRVLNSFVPRPEPGEVAEVFEVPLSLLIDPDRYQIQGRRWRGMTRHYFTVPYGPYYIWGATARILRGLAGQIHS